jgi:hypothetical protein
MLSHNIRVGINGEIKRIRREHVYPLAIENMPAMRRVERKVFRFIVECSG